MDATDLQLDLLGNGGDTLVRCLLVALIAYTLQMVNFSILVSARSLHCIGRERENLCDLGELSCFATGSRFSLTQHASTSPSLLDHETSKSYPRTGLQTHNLRSQSTDIQMKILSRGFRNLRSENRRRWT